MEELIKINYDSDRITVLARNLYDKLNIQSNFTTWFKRMCEYGFEENVDFIPFLEESTGGRPSQDYQITIEMAKEIAMIQRSDEGKRVRQYFIEIEKAWNSPEYVMARALQLSQNKVGELTKEIEVMKPKVVFAEAVENSKDSILVEQLAKLIKQNGYVIGRNSLFTYLRDNGWLCKRGESYNMPTQKSMNMKLFEIKESLTIDSSGVSKIRTTPKVTGKGQVYFVNLFCGTNYKTADEIKGEI